MAIRIIPLNRSMLYIDNLLRPQSGQKQAIQSRLLLGKDISIRLCKATTSSYHLASTIGIYRTALQHNHLLIAPLRILGKEAHSMKTSGDHIIVV